MAECSQREQVLVRALFLRLVTSERTRAVVPVGELYELSQDPAEVYRVIDRLVRSRLLVGQTTASTGGTMALGGTVEIVHESLIEGWPMLRRGALKYITHADSDARVLFDLQRDPGETTNVLEDAAYRSGAAELAALLDQALAS